MKNLFVLFVVIVFLGLSACTPKVDLESEKAQVKTVVDQFKQAFETNDMALFSKIYAHDPEMVVIGTDSAEYWVGWEPLKASVEKQFASYETRKLSVRKKAIKVHDSGKVAWFSELWDWDLLAQGEAVNLQGIRLSGVLEKRNGGWIIVQAHVSVPVYGTAAEY